MWLKKPTFQDCSDPRCRHRNVLEATFCAQCGRLFAPESIDFMIPPRDEPESAVVVDAMGELMTYALVFAGLAVLVGVVVRLVQGVTS